VKTSFSLVLFFGFVLWPFFSALSVPPRENLFIHEKNGSLGVAVVTSRIWG
jgi:uncharacterized membrane protein